MHMDMPMVDYSDDDDEFIPYDPHYEVEDNEFAQYAGDVYESEYDDYPTPPGHYQHAFDFPPITHGHPWVGPDIEDHDDIDEAHWEDPGEYYDSQSDFDEEHHIPIGPGAIMYSYMHDDDNDSVCRVFVETITYIDVLLGGPSLICWFLRLRRQGTRCRSSSGR
jgi:hypothetical protein